jgi:hypothetical protein
MPTACLQPNREILTGKNMPTAKPGTAYQPMCNLQYAAFKSLD